MNQKNYLQGKSVELPLIVREILNDSEVLTLSITDADGIWNAPLFFAFDGSVLLFISSPSSRHCQLPPSGEMDCAFSVHFATSEWSEIRGVQGAGSIRRVAADDRSDAEAIYLGRFTQIAKVLQRSGVESEQLIAKRFAKSEFYMITPHLLCTTDNRESFSVRNAFVYDGNAWLCKDYR